MQLKEWLSAEVGGYYSTISGSAILPDDEASFENVDDMGVDYMHLVSARDVNEEMDAKLLEIPVSAKFIQNSGNWNFYLKPGFSYTMVRSSEYSQESIVSISGFYPHNNVTYHDLPQHGYFLSTGFKSKGKLALKNSINPFIGVGVIVAGKGKEGIFL